ncbi:MAG: GHKL domain-containing protein [Bacteroidetes bacterium]|nr:MAG: GHKL domain-containing protein [Bacteroidota bacterium]
MLLAFAWWSILLFTKNRDAFYAKRDLMTIELVAGGHVPDEAALQAHPDYQRLYKEYRRQEWMIFGEAGVFVITLIIGIWLINRGYNREMLAARQRRNFLLSITHELKSPIASIKLVLETFRKRELRPDIKEKLLQSALEETERLHALVNDLLLSARLETAYQPNFEPLDLAALLNELVDRLEQKYADAIFCRNIAGDLPKLSADKTGMTSVALNLLENAIKYANDKPAIEVRLFRENDHIVFEVADNGPGIPDREKKRIFDKFYRVGNEDTRTTKGTGLGLYIVHEIVRAHGGQISVTDNHPKGSVFRVELPAPAGAEN